MFYRIVDNKLTNLITVEVEMTKNICIVAPVILNTKYRELDGEFRAIRKEAMNLYVAATSNNKKDDKRIKIIENDICDKFESCLTLLVKKYLNTGEKIYLVIEKERG